MFDEKVIMARLLKGESMTDIANEMADILNKVNKEYLEAEAKKKAEAEAKAKALQEKKEEFEEILRQTADWVIKWYPSIEKRVVTEALNDLDVEALIKEIDTTYGMMDKIKNVSVKKYTDVDAALEDFLKMMKW